MQKRFIITCWDGDIYILEGYENVEEITKKMTGMEWVTMPNGSKIKPSSIGKIQSYEDYLFQKDVGNRHKRGQHLQLSSGGRGTWNDGGHVEADADVKSISGLMKNIQIGNANPRLQQGE